MSDGWNPATIWWLGAGILIAADLASGTFYLLMLALGLAAGAVAAHLGFGATVQVATAALVAGGATALWHLKRMRQPRSNAVRDNPDVNIDIGAQVRVDAWQPDGTTRVVYRGSEWIARLEPGAPAEPGRYRISAVEGNWLVLAPLPAPARGSA